MPSRLVITLVACLFISACGSDRPEPPKETPVKQGSRLDFPAAPHLARQRIYFGHQSVGYNLVAGIEELRPSLPGVNLAVKEVPAGGGLPDGPGLFHRKAGRNEAPLSKIEDFERFLVADGHGETLDAAMMKFCYIDFDGTTDVDSLFARYRESAIRISSRFPGLALLHCTVPLTTDRPTWKTTVKGWLGKRNPEFAGNMARARFNDLMRKEYGGRSVLFDLALVESTRPDGTRAAFVVGGKEWPVLAREYTDDGGHLNAVGRKAAAEQLLLLLANAKK